MRSRLIALSAVVVLGMMIVGGPALAREDEGSKLPDLPGMRLADRASKGEVAEFSPGSSEPTAGTASTSSSSSGSPGTSRTSKAKTTDEPDASPILELPATSGLPVIGEVKVGLTAFRRGIDTMPRGLAALAALGTLLSVGGFLLLRDRLVER